eukprot:1177671-Prorocentrum_minimum.AAC.2
MPLVFFTFSWVLRLHSASTLDRYLPVTLTPPPERAREPGASAESRRINRARPLPEPTSAELRRG